LNAIRDRLKSSRRKVLPGEAPSRKEFAVFLFESTQGAIKAERVLLRAGLSVKLIPTPRQLSSDCGTALRCDWSDAEKAKDTLREAKVAFASMHRDPGQL
jgi:hypothetical protein